MQKASNTAIVLIAIVVIFVCYTLVQEFELKPKQKTSTINTSTTVDEEINTIRNRPFALAGMDMENGNDAGMEVGDDVVAINKEPAYKTYLIGSKPVLTDNGMNITTTLYEMGTTMPNGAFDTPLEANGRYVEIRFTIENKNKKPTTLNISTIRLLTKEEYEYFPIKQKRSCEKDYPTYTKSDEMVEEMNPGSICTGTLLFDIATTTTPKHLQLKLF